MQKTRLFILAGGLCGSVLLFLAACAGANLASEPAASAIASPAAESSPSPAPNAAAAQATGETRMDTRLVAADNHFGFDLFNQLVSRDQNENVFFSPLSVAFALAMTYNGATGETKAAMEKTLRFKGINHAELNQASAALLHALKSADPKIELAIANSLWARQGVKFYEPFLARNRQFFGAEIATLNFSDPQAKNTINAWVSKNTNGKIPSIIDRIDPQKVLFLINAIYFKGQWQKKFDPALTHSEPFHLPGGAQKPVPLMSQSGEYSYYRGDGFQAVALPYGQGGTGLVLFLPDEETSLKEFLKGFSYEKWEEWTQGFRRTPGDIKIPRFKLNYERTLNDPLKALGMEIAFTDRATFDGISEQQKLFISEVKHKAIVEVNEEGTEAAAATSVGMSVTSMRPQPQRFTFIADHPFLMAIRDQQTGAILFLGVVVDPN